MAKVALRCIPSDASRVDRDCARMLTEMQRRALRGEFQAVALATVTEGPDGSIGTAWSAPERQSELAGAVAYLNHRFMSGIENS